MTEKQIQEAIRWGRADLEERKKKGLPLDEENPQWEVNLGEGIGKAYLRSEFKTVSHEARKYAALDWEIPLKEIKTLWSLTKGKLVFRLTLFGKGRHFARDYKVSLEFQDKRIAPIYKDIHKGVPSGLEDPDRAFRAVYFAHFPAEGINPNSTVTLVAISTDKQELRFPFDLSKMK